MSNNIIRVRNAALARGALLKQADYARPEDDAEIGRPVDNGFYDATYRPSEGGYRGDKGSPGSYARLLAENAAGAARAQRPSLGIYDRAPRIVTETGRTIASPEVYFGGRADADYEANHYPMTNQQLWNRRQKQAEDYATNIYPRDSAPWKNLVDYYRRKGNEHYLNYIRTGTPFPRGYSRDGNRFPEDVDIMMNMTPEQLKLNRTQTDLMGDARRSYKSALNNKLPS